ncbi:MAG: helicase-related protein [Candidatus Micrarchaeota archaeon]|nr:helicase-related protein [Candidatus Micrarchaeota archaeon]
MASLLKTELAPRDYQLAIAETAKNKNTLVVLPTGLGKTLVAMLVMDAFLSKGGRCVFLAPTKPLAEQHHKTFKTNFALGEEEVALLTGAIPAKKRAAVWKTAKIVSATPQTMENDLKGRRVELSAYSLVIFDEAHRTVGKYAYTYVARKCAEAGTRTMALTASPGSRRDKIEEIMKTLGIDAAEIRSEQDDDVKEYVQPLETKWIEVELPPEFRRICNELGDMISERTKYFTKLGLLPSHTKHLGKRKLLELRPRLVRATGGWKYMALSRYAELFNLVHAQELIETQGAGTFVEFFKKMGARETKSKAVVRILGNETIRRAITIASASQIDHPKIGKLLEVVEQRKGKTFIVFVQYRVQIKRVVEELNRLEGIRAIRFVGKREGVSAQEQKETIEKFRAGEFNVLVASSIGEEGLDIPSVDCVIFYEPVPSEIRMIQRRGRTARAKAGEVIFLITKDTRDEAYYWVAKHREKQMKHIIGSMSGGKQKKEGRKGREPEEKTEKHGPAQEHGRGQRKITDFFS